MKKLALLAAALLVSVQMVSAKVAPVEKKLDYSVNLGVAIPMGTMADVAGIGFGGGAAGLYNVNKDLGIGLNLAYTSFSGKDLGAGLGKWKYSNLDILAIGKYKFGTSSAKPYILGGIGLSSLSVTIPATSYTIGSYTFTTPEVTGSTTNLEIAPGAGVEFGGKTKFFVEIRYAVILTSGSSTSFLPINAGLLF